MNQLVVILTFGGAHGTCVVIPKIKKY